MCDLCHFLTSLLIWLLTPQGPVVSQMILINTNSRGTHAEKEIREMKWFYHLAGLGDRLGWGWQEGG